MTRYLSSFKTAPSPKVPTEQGCICKHSKNLSPKWSKTWNERLFPKMSKSQSSIYRQWRLRMCEASMSWWKQQMKEWPQSWNLRRWMKKLKSWGRFWRKNKRKISSFWCKWPGIRVRLPSYDKKWRKDRRKFLTWGLRFKNNKKSMNSRFRRWSDKYPKCKFPQFLQRLWSNLKKNSQSQNN